MIRKLLKSTIFKLLMGVVVGVILGQFVNDGFMSVVVMLKYILAQLIFFMVPLIVLAFVSSSISKMGSNASKMLGSALGLAYLSSIGAAFMAMMLGYWVLPRINIPMVTEKANQIPDLLFRLEIPPLMSVLTALVFAIMIGLATVWTKSEMVVKLLETFQDMVMTLINKILIPILPFFIAFNFCALSFEGAVTKQAMVFINVLAILIVAHMVWVSILYLIGALVLRKNPWQVIRYYAPPYFTALGTMSSAATLPVSLEAARKSPILNKDVVDFAIPLFSNIHLCGSALSQVFFVMTVSIVLYGSLPEVSTIVLFVFLLGIFAVGAPGVPGGAIIATLGIIISILGFDEAGTALLITIVTLQDSFGTGCNIVGDGALTMIMTKIDNKPPDF